MHIHCRRRAQFRWIRCWEFEGSGFLNVRMGLVLDSKIEVTQFHADPELESESCSLDCSHVSSVGADVSGLLTVFTQTWCWEFESFGVSIVHMPPLLELMVLASWLFLRWPDFGSLRVLVCGVFTSPELELMVLAS